MTMKKIMRGAAVFLILASLGFMTFSKLNAASLDALKGVDEACCG